MKIIVTRAADQAESLAQRLMDRGHDVAIVPVIAIAEAGDGGASLRTAVSNVHEFDWVALTSPNAVATFVGALKTSESDNLALAGSLRIAVVGPGTESSVRDAGLRVDLVAQRSMAEGLLESFGSIPSARILLPQAAGARPVLADGLRAMGWEVAVIEAYRTVAQVPSTIELQRAQDADAIVFTSSSTVTAWVESARPYTPTIIVSIGPATSATARSCGLEIAIEAELHTLDGIVAAIDSLSADSLSADSLSARMDPSEFRSEFL
jgi:uroporphyrinogen-III synthase